jgi:hypothetical protein
MVSKLAAAGVLAFAMTVLVPTPAPAQAPSPVIGIQAVHMGETTLQQNHFTYAVSAGSNVDDAAVIINFADHPIDVDTYAADLVQATGGGVAPAQVDQPPTGVGLWLTLRDKHLTLPPKSEVVEPFHLQVPASASPGEYGGAVVAVYTPSATASGSQFTVQTRVALIARVSIPGALHLGARLGPLRAHRTRSGVDFSVAVHDTGNVLVTVHGSVAAHHVGSKRARAFALKPGDIYVIPGGQAVLKAHWAKPPLYGHYRAKALVTVNGSGQPDERLQSLTVDVWFIPWRLIAAAAAVLVLILVAILTRRRWRRWFQRRRDDRRAVREFKRARRGQSRPDQRLGEDEQVVVGPQQLDPEQHEDDLVEMNTTGSHHEP